MATYTADDFARADFARHPDGGLAMRVRPLDVRPWETGRCYAADASMALTGWVPVPHGAYTRHDSPDYADGGMAAAAIEEEAEGDLWAKATPGQGSSEWWMARWQEAADRANACGLAAHMWKETAREHVRRVRTARGYIEALQGGIDMERARAEKAEQERDEARAALDKVSPRHPAVPTELLYVGHEAASARTLTAREHLDAAIALMDAKR